MGNSTKLMLAALLFAGMPSAGNALDVGDPAKGEQIFKRCMACHRIGEGAKNLIGPVLNGVIGRTAGTYQGFHYSDLNHHAGESGLTWTEDNIFEYLPDPNAFLKKYLTDHGKAAEAVGSTRMTFRLKDEQERKDVIAYLEKFSKK
jgi:cytochrome c